MLVHVRKAQVTVTFTHRNDEEQGKVRQTHNPQPEEERNVVQHERWDGGWVASCSKLPVQSQAYIYCMM